MRLSILPLLLKQCLPQILSLTFYLYHFKCSSHYSTLFSYFIYHLYTDYINYVAPMRIFHLNSRLLLCNVLYAPWSQTWIFVILSSSVFLELYLQNKFTCTHQIFLICFLFTSNKDLMIF